MGHQQNTGHRSRTLRRRDLLALVAGVSVGWPLPVLAQERVIGYLSGGSRDGDVPLLRDFREGLAETGHTEGRDLRIEYRFAEGHYDREAELAADLVHQRVELIVTVGGSKVALAAKTATSTTPIIFFIGGDPLWKGLVLSFARPGGNVTGVAALSTELVPKRLELLQEIAPNAVVGALVNPTLLNIEREVQLTQDAARAKGILLQILPASTEDDFETAFGRLAELHVGALLVSADPFFAAQRNRIVALAAHYATPAMYSFRADVEAGGLISYGGNSLSARRQVGVYAGRILNGEKPSDLPVVQPTNFELVINLKTAKALGLTVPQSLLAGADEVIE